VDATTAFELEIGKDEHEEAAGLSTADVPPEVATPSGGPVTPLIVLPTEGLVEPEWDLRSDLRHLDVHAAVENASGVITGKADEAFTVNDACGVRMIERVRSH